mgnify:FL=1
MNPNLQKPFRTLLPESRPPSTSWWLTASQQPREQWQAAVEQENVRRIRGSKEERDAVPINQPRSV